MITGLVMTDGRAECLKRTFNSVAGQVSGVDRWVIHDDSGDVDYRRWLIDTFTAAEVVSTHGRSGFGGAIRSAWTHLTAAGTTGHVFHLEDDFTFNRPVDLADLVTVLDHHPHLAQIALLRQAWNPQEKAAGGIIQLNPGDFTPRETLGVPWLEHRRFFTTNPCLYRADLMSREWPTGDQSEGRFGLDLVRTGWAFAVAGHGEEWVTHIGDTRAGVGY